VSNRKKLKKPRRERGYVKDAIRQGLASGPGYHDLYVFHDDWCALLKRGEACNCYPAVRLHSPFGPARGTN
jgi:hypothetical protein